MNIAFSTMQRLKNLLILQRQAALFLKSAEKPNLGSVRQASSFPVLTCTHEKILEPFSLFVCEPDGVIPISEDAHRIYENNKSAIEEHEVRQLLPYRAERLKGTRKCSSTVDSISDNEGVIYNQCVQIAMTHQRKPLRDNPNVMTMSSLDADVSQLNCSSDDSQPAAPSSQQQDSHLPSQEKLEKMKATISELMPKFFNAQTHNYSLYTKDVRFENNYWGQNKIYTGINAYASELFKLKLRCNMAYCSINMYIINISSNSEEGTIRVRWTMKGIPQFEGFKFWKFNLLNIRREGGIKEKMSKTFKVHDGVNNFWLDKHGAIYKHRLDKVIPDEETKVANAAAVNKISKMLNKKLAGATNSSGSSSSVKFQSVNSRFLNSTRKQSS